MSVGPPSCLRIAVVVSVLGIFAARVDASDKEAETRRRAVRNEVVRAAIRHRVDPKLATSVAGVESGFEPRARSRMGAIGVMQLMPGTARTFGVNPWDYRQNIDAGVRHLRWLQRRYPGNLEAALAAYNAGVASVDRHGGVPPFAETKRYVGLVLSRFRGTPAQNRTVRRSRNARRPPKTVACSGTETAFDATGRLYVRTRAVATGCEPLR